MKFPSIPVAADMSRLKLNRPDSRPVKSATNLDPAHAGCYPTKKTVRSRAVVSCSTLLAAASLLASASSVPASIFPNGQVYFEANRGQADAEFQFVARGPQCNVLLAATEAVMVLCKPDESAPSFQAGRFQVGGLAVRETRPVRFHLEGANADAKAIGVDPLSGVANYFIGNNPSAWQEHVPLYPKVQFDSVYPGIKLVYRADDSAQLEYDFVVAAEADPSRIVWRIEGADRVEVDRAGELVLKIGNDEIRHHKPVIYQVIRGERRPIQGEYLLMGQNRVGFRIGRYDPHAPLVIDPTLDFTQFIAGDFPNRGWGIATDGMGNLWVVGETLSLSLGATNGLGATNTYFRPHFLGGSGYFGDAFVGKYSSSNLVYLTFFGGSAQDSAFAVAAGPDGAGYVTGYTDSQDFPIRNAFQPHLGGTNLNALGLYPIDAFVTKFRTNGSIEYSTYLGGRNRDVGFAIAVDSQGRAYVAGQAESYDFPITNAIQGLYLRKGGTNFLRNYDGRFHKLGVDAFVARFNTNGSKLEYSTYLGGDNYDVVQGIALDSSNAIVVGVTSSTNFPVTPFALSTNLNQSTNGIFLGNDGFVTKLSDLVISGTNNTSTNISLVYSTYLGGKTADKALAIAPDPANPSRFFVTGTTTSTNFPMTAAALTFTNWLRGTGTNSEVFVTCLDFSGLPAAAPTQVYSVVFGGRQRDEGLAITADPQENAYIVGLTTSGREFAGTSYTSSSNFFTIYSSGVNPSNPVITKVATNNAYVVKLDISGTVNTNFFASYLNGPRDDVANGVVWDPVSGGIYVYGTTSSHTFPGGDPKTFRGGYAGKQAAYVTHITFP